MSSVISQKDACGTAIVVRSLKYDGRVHRTWPAKLVRKAGALVVVEGVFTEEVRHPHLGRIEPGTRSVEFFWTDRFYSIFRFERPAGLGLRNFYCNVNTPAVLEGGVLSFVDLDIDVLVAPDFTCTVLDEDEFASHAREFGYTEATLDAARSALQELLARVERRGFPFNQETV